MPLHALKYEKNEDVKENLSQVVSFRGQAFVQHANFNGIFQGVM
jgi:hypothetical protein